MTMTKHKPGYFYTMMLMMPRMWVAATTQWYKSHRCRQIILGKYIAATLIAKLKARRMSGIKLLDIHNPSSAPSLKTNACPCPFSHQSVDFQVSFPSWTTFAFSFSSLCCWHRFNSLQQDVHLTEGTGSVERQQKLDTTAEADSAGGCRRMSGEDAAEGVEMKTHFLLENENRSAN